jgi:glycosyltransferase involved in cell wall biosynthesis
LSFRLLSASGYFSPTPPVNPAPVPARMKILHLLGAAEDHGGIVSVVRGIQAATAADGLRHAVWVNSAFVNRRSPALDLRPNRFALDEAASHPRLLLRAALALPGLFRLLRTEPFDVVHAHTRGGFAAAMLLNRLFGRRLLFTNHTYANRTGLYRGAAAWPGFNTVVLTPNMAKHYGVVPDEPKVSVISACGGNAFWQVPPVTAAQSSPLRLVGVGNLVRWKNWHLLLEALAGLPADFSSQWQFELWGPTPEDPAAKAYAAELGVLAARPELAGRVHLRGPTTDVIGALRGANWFVLPSTNEPCSVALIEALALGLPAVVSASGGNVDILRPEHTGVFFRPDDAADLRRQLARVLRGEVAVASPEAIRGSVGGRTASAVGAEYHRLYRRLAG